MSIRQWLSEKAAIVRAIGAAAACVIGARIVAPGINPDVLGDFFRSGGASPLVRIYDWLVGGAMGRGALLALGIMPYVTARIYLRLARIVAPSLGDPARRQPLIRRLTLGFSAVQSFGFAKFLESLPGAVANPGPRFVVTTVLTLTASAMTAMWLWESQWRGGKAPAADEPDEVDRESVSTVHVAGDPQLLNAPLPDLEIVQPAREKVGLK
jgi:preprotein translocase subunit SecY